MMMIVAIENAISGIRIALDGFVKNYGRGVSGSTPPAIFEVRLTREYDNGDRVRDNNIQTGRWRFIMGDTSFRPWVRRNGRPARSAVAETIPYTNSTEYQYTGGPRG